LGRVPILAYPVLSVWYFAEALGAAIALTTVAAPAAIQNLRAVSP
jgi:hypothetical protein